MLESVDPTNHIPDLAVILGDHIVHGVARQSDAEEEERREADQIY